MPLTVCFDALGTCFSFETLVDALDEILGEELRHAGSGARMVIMDWVRLPPFPFPFPSPFPFPFPFPLEYADA